MKVFTVKRRARRRVDRWKTGIPISSKLFPKTYAKAYMRLRRQRDPIFRLAQYLRSRIRYALKSNAKSAASAALLGCTHVQLRKWLELQFTEGMTWTNYGMWHVDHIRPCCSFNLADPKEQANCFNYRNLQPLWAKANLAKSGTYTGPITMPGPEMLVIDGEVIGQKADKLINRWHEVIWRSRNRHR